MKAAIDNKMLLVRTKTKLSMVRWIYFVTSTFFGLFNKSLKQVQAKRKGINWDLDLNEAVDLCLFATGEYEPDLIQLYRPLIEGKDKIIVDIGANVGAHTLIMANMMAENSKVYAIEPTDFAFDKLDRNLAVNPKLKNRVEKRKVLLTDPAHVVAISNISSSWDISKKIDDPNRNVFDGGFAKSCADAAPMTFDEFVEQEGITRIDLVKLDVDGNEIDIMRGADKVFKDLRPILLVELSPIHFDQMDFNFEDLVNELININYDFYNALGDKIDLDTEKLEQWIPHGTLVNLIGHPRNR
jgi:FkbM family methyltransferase